MVVLAATGLCCDILPPGLGCYVADACCRVDNWVLLSLHDRTKFVSAANLLIRIAVDLLW
jgi:hypothetical protein